MSHPHHQVRPDAPAPRIVSLVPNLTEVLWWIGAADHVVGRTEDAAPAHGYDDAAVLGTIDVPTEDVLALGPDLVLAKPRNLADRDAVAAGADLLAVVPRTLEDAGRLIVDLAGRVGREKQGEGLVQSLRRAAAGPPSATLRAFVPILANPWLPLGADSVGADILAAAGFDVVPRTRTSVIDPGALDPDEVDVVLLPDAPFDAAEADRSPFTRSGLPVRTIDGATVAWWGPRTPSAIGDLRRLHRTLLRRS